MAEKREIPLADMCVEEDCVLTQALAQLDRSGKKVLFVVRDGRLVAAFSDGDIRRHILRGGALDATVRSVANYKPLYLRVGEEGKARAFMRQKVIQALPILDEGDHILRILFADEAIQLQTQSLAGVPVVINAGGKGTRLYPYTKILPKPLIPIGEVPVAEHILNRFYAMGCTQFYMILNEKRNMIKAYFGEMEKPYALTFIDEEAPLGTGGGLSLLKGKLRNTFVFANCDTIIDKDFGKILQTHKTSGNLITMIVALKHFDIPYGVIEAGDNGSIAGFSEKPQISFLTNTGCYIVEPAVVEGMTPGEAVSFPAVVERYRAQGLPVGIFPIGEQAWLDMGQLDSMEEMKRRLLLDADE